jgi:hypothetical protein
VIVQLSRFDFSKQIRVPFQDSEQFDQRKGRFGLPIFLTGERIHAASEDLTRFSLIERKFLAYTHNELGIDDRGIHLLIEVQHHGTCASRFRRIQNGLSACCAEISCYPRDGRALTLVGIAMSRVSCISSAFRQIGHFIASGWFSCGGT